MWYPEQVSSSWCSLTQFSCLMHDQSSFHVLCNANIQLVYLSLTLAYNILLLEAAFHAWNTNSYIKRLMFSILYVYSPFFHCYKISKSKNNPKIQHNFEIPLLNAFFFQFGFWEVECWWVQRDPNWFGIFIRLCSWSIFDWFN